MRVIYIIMPQVFLISCATDYVDNPHLISCATVCFSLRGLRGVPCNVGDAQSIQQ